MRDVRRLATHNPDLALAGAFVDAHRGLRLNDFLARGLDAPCVGKLHPSQSPNNGWGFLFGGSAAVCDLPESAEGLCPPPSFLITSQFGEIGLASAPFLVRPSLQNARSLADRYPDPRQVLDGVSKDFLRLAKIIADIEQAIDFHAVAGPLFDLVVIAVVREERIVSLFVGPIAH